VMSAWTTSVPARSITLTDTTNSVPSVIGVKSGGSSRACTRSDVVAFAKFIWTQLGQPSFALFDEAGDQCDGG
jgi:hypothetical protein